MPDAVTRAAQTSNVNSGMNVGIRIVGTSSCASENCPAWLHRSRVIRHGTRSGDNLCNLEVREATTGTGWGKQERTLGNRSRRSKVARMNHSFIMLLVISPAAGVTFTLDIQNDWRDLIQ